tara:strand:- start:77 stop:679 length:603 start_codon:yes stop_codon:yes gene_type:complete
MNNSEQAKVALLFSGGIDSMLLAERAHKAERLGVLIFINYGQPAYFEEMKAVAYWSTQRGYEVQVVDADIAGVDECMAIGPTEDGLRILPGRNMVMCSHAANVAVARGCKVVWYGANADDRDYPDCNENFVSSMNMTLAASMVPVKIEAPLVRMNKKQIVEEAVRIHMDIDKAWSCYESVNFNEPCGLCHSCKERIDAGA